jgi:predicted dehydrogenase
MNKILVLGAGGMASEYIKVLQSLNREVIVIGKSAETVGKIQAEFGCQVYSGGLENVNLSELNQIEFAINAVSVEELFHKTELLIKQGIPNILVEKPGAMLRSEIESMLKFSNEKNIKIWIGYNRRFYQSVKKAMEMISDSKEKIKSFHFEFTEWAHVIQSYNFSKELLENWFIANSTHLIDLAFYMGGRPTKINSLVAGGLEWHSTGSIYVGSGKSESGALFSYHSNWTSPGRWSLDILTDSMRYIFKPLEILQIQRNGSVKIEEVSIENDTDTRFKPGLLDQVIAFLQNDESNLCKLKDHLENWNIYDKIKYGCE